MLQDEASTILSPLASDSELADFLLDKKTVVQNVTITARAEVVKLVYTLVSGTSEQ